jgi:DNA-binding protein H-NS
LVNLFPVIIFMDLNMSTLQDLIAQREALDRQIEETRRNARRDAIARAQALVHEFGLTAADVFGGAAARSSGKAPSAQSGRKVAPKYRDPASGKTWTGRGRAPTWLEGKDRAQFLIA